ncbi:NB-ARC domain-containing protein [Micromonospora palomenae]|uniref:NB-ARC domain-containing protein n=1 Tax=Micromonospora palomenae TaxID=1461247 RepID=A0A561WE66_9ACTN|nr:FxSxx-COOH system tetratricopeptide repeat protein [Micromonospora palomenae]TWG22149.1 NB-ARC domain-containing protein [Micromonospora palomenae]
MSDPSASGTLFVSHAGRDRAWAEWVAWHLRAAGHTVELDCVDWAAGDNFIERMHAALARPNPLVALLSTAYLDASRYTSDEWTARLAQRRRDPRARLIPLRVDDVTLDGIWAPIVVPDLFGLSTADAVTTLLTAVDGPPSSTAAPPYPHVVVPATEAGPRPPGSLPPVWNVARRNPAFTGRDAMLITLREKLQAGQHAVVQALQGMGGVGKTQLAIEYAHRFAGEYELVWWIASEQPELIGEQLAALAAECGIAPTGTDTPTAVHKLRGHLRQSLRWLIIFDNVEDRDAITDWLPDGSGHVVVTSRSPVWAGVAQPVGVDVFARSESVALLRTHLPHVSEAEADQLAEALGDLPLAVAQAADLLAETGMPVPDYLQTLDEHAADLLGGRPPVGYPAPLGAAVRVATERLTREDPAAGQLLTLCAFLAPEPVPLHLFRHAPDQTLPEPLATTARSGIALDRTVGHITRYGLARPSGDGPILHRLTQAILKDTLTPEQRTTTREQVDQLLIAARPDDGTDPAHWPRWTRLMPHILAADPATTTNTELRYLIHSAIWHLLARGDARTALPLAHHLHTEWTRRHGPDDDTTLFASDLLAHAHRQLGQYQQARALDEDILTRRRRIHGDDHPHTLNSASNLAGDIRQLGEYEQARALDEDTLTRYRRVLGDDNFYTLSSANNLAVDLSQLGQYETARALIEDTLTRRRRVLGDDHPRTLSSANNLAINLRQLGQHEQARALDEDTLTRRRLLLGDDHPDTLSSANNLATNLRHLGQHEQARALDEDTLTRYRRVLGDDHPGTLGSANNLAVDLRQLGQHEQARALNEDTLTRRRRVLGDDHPDTLSSANNLAINLRHLGQHEQARALNEDTLTRYRRVLGDDHPHTLSSANNLAADLRHLGQHEQARALNEDTLTRRRRVLGDDHPHTLSSANNLAADLRHLGQHEQARALNEDTLTRRRRVLGDDHPHTLNSANNLAADLRQLGQHEQARALNEDNLTRRRIQGDDHPDARKPAAK